VTKQRHEVFEALVSVMDADFIRSRRCRLFTHQWSLITCRQQVEFNWLDCRPENRIRLGRNAVVSRAEHLLVSARGERPAHHNEVAGQLGALCVRERQSPAFDVTKLAIVGRQLAPQIDDLNLHLPTPSLSAMVFRGRNEAGSKALALPRRVDRQHAEVATRAAQLDEHAPGQDTVRILENEECASIHF
jgi:hypothetical protein